MTGKFNPDDGSLPAGRARATVRKAAAPPRNSRLDCIKTSYSDSILLNRNYIAAAAPVLFAQLLNRHFFEKYDVVIAMVLQAEVAFERAAATLRLKIELARGNRLAFGVVGDLNPVDGDHSVGPIERDLHGVPFRAGLEGLGQRLGQ